MKRTLMTCMLAFLLTGLVEAQQVDRPDIKVGDQWSFVVYYATPSTVPNRTWVITSVAQGVIEGTEDGQPLRLTPDLNVLESPRRKDSNTLALSFPLHVGKKWRYETDTLFKDNNSTARSVVEVEVVRRETVRVVAGEFDAFMLVSKGSFRGLSKGGPGIVSGEATSTYWYAPGARAIVKLVAQSPYRGASTVELVRARPGR